MRHLYFTIHQTYKHTVGNASSLNLERLFLNRVVLLILKLNKTLNIYGFLEIVLQ